MSLESSDSGSVESSAEGGATGTRSRRARFREWRHRRPFAGGVLLLLAGVLIAYVPMQFAFELLLVGGSYTYVGLMWAVGVFLCGAFALYRPDLSTIFGVLGVALSILSLLGALGGLLIGMIVGIIGGNLCVAWQRPDAAGRSGGGDPGRGDDRPVRTDGGTPDDRTDRTDGDESTSRLAIPSSPLSRLEGSLRSPSRPTALAAALAAGPLSRLRSEDAGSGGSPRGASLDRVRRFARRGVPDSGESLLGGATSPPAPGRLVDAATSGGPSKRIAVTVAVLVVTSGTLTLVTAIPVAAILGDEDETTYTVDVGEIRLGDGGRICAASVGDDTYRVTITNATLVDATIYQQRGDDAVKTDFPSVQVDDTMVMYTRSDDEQFELLATTAGCTDEDQTSRTVFRNQYQTSEHLRGSEGVTMVNMEATDATVPEPGGFRFAAPGDDNASSPAPNATGVADDVDDVIDDTLVDRLTDDADDLDRVGGALGEVDDVAENATGDATNATDDAVASAEETVDNTTDEVNGTVDETTDDVNETVNDTVEHTPDTVGGTTETVDHATETVDETTDGVDDAVDETTDTVDDSTGTVDETTDDVDEAVNDTVDETSDTVDDSTGTVDETTDTVDDTTDDVDETADTGDGTTDDVDETTDDTTDTVDETTDETTDTVDDTTDDVDETTDSVESTATSTPTATPDDGEDRPAWLDQVDDEEAVMETIEETDGDVDDVEDVTTETEPLDEETIEADDNLTRLDNGTVLLLNGTDPAEIDWSVDTDDTSEETETVDDSDDGVDEATVESDDDTTLSLVAL